MFGKKEYKKDILTFVMEKRLNADPIYFSEKNGIYINESVSVDKDKAKKIFDAIVENKGNVSNRIILEDVEVCDE